MVDLMLSIEGVGTSTLKDEISVLVTLTYGNIYMCHFY